MPYVAASGPLGLQGIHLWNNVFSLNNLEAALPRVDLDKITGLFSLPEVEDRRDPKIGQNGEVLYPSYTRGKTITYEGRLIAADSSIYAYRWSMLAAFTGFHSTEGQMKISPHATWGTGTWAFSARVLALDIDDEIITRSMGIIPTPYQLPFILSLRMKDNSITQL